MEMYLTMPVKKIHLDHGVIDLQDRLFIPKNFFKDLFRKDDKSFIMALYELIESKCSSLLLFHLKVPGLNNVISRLQMSNNESGKTLFLHELKLLDEQDIKYITALSKWRSYFINDAKETLTYDDIWESLDKNTVRRFALDFSPYETTLQKYSNLQPSLLSEEALKQIEPSNLIERAKTNTRLHIWIGASHLLHTLADMTGFSDFLSKQKTG